MNSTARDIHEAGHCCFAMSHDLAIAHVHLGETTLVAPLTKTHLSIALGMHLAGEAAESAAQGRPVNLLAEGCSHDIDGAMQLLWHREDKTKQLAAAIDHVHHYLSQAGVWRCVEGIARILTQRGGYLSGVELEAFADFYHLPWCTARHVADSPPLASRRLSRSDDTTASDVMHEVYRKQAQWRQQAWQGLTPRQRQAALTMARGGGLGLVAPRRWLA